MSDRDRLIIDRPAEGTVWSHAYAAALAIPPARGEVPTNPNDETERMRADRCAQIADLAVYRYRERVPR